ncbi:hypothetical protein FG385_06215 [Amycolatopsis alkalitolerans]|uniref:ESX-1 secretion-associated protein n=1 Tax=Amycolatopsis alkalitolerans TaxID=2547244 RepID=A0A5C4M695_9PSEU|nr:hypothetical protein FG385_06215 [Amycolatopsis alkalitolerans]
MDGRGFHVDVDKVAEAGRGISRSVKDQQSFQLRGLCGDAGLYGHQGVHDALMDFCVRWSDGLDMLTDDADKIGSALTRAANAYRGVDDATARTLGGDPGEGAVKGG